MTGRWSAVVGVDLAVDRHDLAGRPAAGWLSAAVCALLFLGWLLTRSGSAPDRVPLVLTASVAAATAPLSTALFLFIAIGWPVGPELTRIAGNPPVNAADTDLIVVRSACCPASSSAHC